jgi:imidazole glycerol-phosphate synthase subunit HisF
MLRPRIIPCLLVRSKGLVKTVGFGAAKYVGDPINAVRIFNEKAVDELMVLDIDATVAGREPDYKMIADLAAECRMPLCYGGGVCSAEQAKTIIGLGVEKVAVSAAAVAKPELIGAIAQEIGSQSVTIVADVRSRGGDRYEMYTHNGTRATGQCPIEFAQRAQQLGAGEIVINSIDLDGKMSGYDMALAARVREAVSIPMTVLGGAGSLKDIGALIARFGIVGAAAGSLFVFKGVYKAVLINYPAPPEKESLLQQYRGRA